MTKLYFLVFFLFSALQSFAQVFLQASNSSDAYSSIDSKGFGYEVPDCKHPVIHIASVWDSKLKKPVFAFDIHRDLDDDRCINFDRQRNEVKTWSSSPSALKGYYGDTFFHRWKFFIDSAFQPSPNFCHIHQIKAGDGPDADSPLLTITPRYGSTSDKIQIIYVAPAEGGNSTVFRTTGVPRSDQDTAKNRAEKMRRLFAQEAHAAGMLGMYGHRSGRSAHIVSARGQRILLGPASSTSSPMCLCSGGR